MSEQRPWPSLWWLVGAASLVVVTWLVWWLTLTGGFEADDFFRLVGRYLGQGLVIAVVGLAVAWNVYGSTQTFRMPPHPFGDQEMRTFRQAFPASPAVYVDRFAFTAFFGHHHAWDWTFVPGPAGWRRIDVWNVSRAEAHVLVCRDREAFIVDLTEARVYWKVAECLRRTGADSVTLFGIELRGFMAPLPGTVDAAEVLGQRATREGLRLRGAIRERGNVYARFELAPPPLP